MCRCDSACAAALLSATGSQLTRLESLLCPSDAALMDAIAQLNSLQKLSLDHTGYDAVTTDFRRLKVVCCLFPLSPCLVRCAPKHNRYETPDHALHLQVVT